MKIDLLPLIASCSPQSRSASSTHFRVDGRIRQILETRVSCSFVPSVSGCLVETHTESFHSCRVNTLGGK